MSPGMKTQRCWRRLTWAGQAPRDQVPSLLIWRNTAPFVASNLHAAHVTRELLVVYSKTVISKRPCSRVLVTLIGNYHSNPFTGNSYLDLTCLFYDSHEKCWIRVVKPNTHLNMYMLRQNGRVPSPSSRRAHCSGILLLIHVIELLTAWKQEFRETPCKKICYPTPWKQYKTKKNAMFK